MKQPLFSTSYAPRDGESTLDEIEGRLARDGRLKVSNVGVRIETRGNRLHLGAKFPSKPDSDNEKLSQQRLTLGYRVNPAGLKLAEQEARRVGALLDCKQSSWEPYLKLSAIAPLSVAKTAQKCSQNLSNIKTFPLLPTAKTAQLLIELLDRSLLLIDPISPPSIMLNRQNNLFIKLAI